MTKQEMLLIVQSQLATDLNCTPDELNGEKDSFVFTEAKDNPGRRPFPRSKQHFEMLFMGKSIVVSASPDILNIAKTGVLTDASLAPTILALRIGDRKRSSRCPQTTLLEEALCFGRIDGQMRSIDETKYHKYFARRRTKSVWSEKNKKIIEVLREKGLMTELGEAAVLTAKMNGTWDAPKDAPASDEQKEAFTANLSGFSPAYENICNMPASVQRTYKMRYLSFKTEEARSRDFDKIVDRLNNNLKPM